MPALRETPRLVLSLLVLVLSCSPTEPDDGPGPDGSDNDKVAALVLTPGGATLLEGESLTLVAHAFDDSGKPLEDVKVTWSSFLPQFATVVDGRVQGVATGGSVITATVGSVNTTVTVTVLPNDPSLPSSDELLASAREAGLITEEEVLAYRVYAAFGDARLPIQYKGRVESTFDAVVLTELRERFDDLSAPMQEALGMYLLRPDDPGSWFNPPLPDSGLDIKKRPACRGGTAGWHSVSKSTSKVKVWFEYAVAGQREQAILIEEAVNTDIWPKLTALGLAEPLTDEAYAGCNGGDSKLDIYVSRNMNGNHGLTMPEGYDNTQAPTYILIWDGLSNSELKTATAHEVMHAIQWAYKTKAAQPSYGWIRDATANWAIDHVYGQTLQHEQDFADCFMSTPAYSLDDRSTGNCSVPKVQGAARDYGAYLFFQYVAKKHGAGVVKQVLEKLVTEGSSLTAVDSVVPGKLEKVWPEFGKTLWNQAPIDTKGDSFKTWDGLTKVVKSNDVNADLAGAAEARHDLQGDLNNLANRYYHYTFSDPNTRSILFHNGWFENITQSKEPVKVLAMWNDASGNWHEEDWSDYEYVGLCRDLKAQRATDLVIVVSNAKFEPSGGGKVTAAKTAYLKRSNVGCWKYKGTSKVVEKGAGWSGPGKTLDSNLEFQVLGDFSGVDYDYPTLPHTKRLGAFLVLLASGDFTLDIDYSSGGCNYRHGPTKYTLGPTPGAMLLNPFNELKSTDSATQRWLSHPSRSYTLAASDGRIVQVSVSGKDCVGPEIDAPGGLLLTNEGDAEDSISPPLVKPNGELSGTFSYADATFTWTLQPQSEP